MSTVLESSDSGCLLDMPSGCRLRVDELTGSLSDRSRLYSLGILPGTELELCQAAEGSGAVHVKVRQCSLVLGQGMAQCIRCCPAGGEGRRRAHRHCCPKNRGYIRPI